MPDAQNPFSRLAQPNSALGVGVEALAGTFQLLGVRAGQKVSLFGHAQILQGAGGGGINLRFRRGTLTGALVQADQATLPSLLAAANSTMTRGMTDNALTDDPVYAFTVTDSTAATLVEWFIEGKVVN